MNNVYVRLVLYVLSAFLGQIPAIALGWFTYGFVDGVIHIAINLEGAVTAVVTTIGISGGVFKIWGKK